jgi:hypothetical protein
MTEYNDQVKIELPLTHVGVKASEAMIEVGEDA